MARTWWIVVGLVGGCISSEVAISRQGEVAGTAASGGIGFDTAAMTYVETGRQNVALGMSLHLLDQAPSMGVVSTLGVAARYAHQLGGARAWRGLARASAGFNGCRVVDCGDAAFADRRRHSYQLALGVERMVMSPDPARPQHAAFISADVALVYTRSSDELLGHGDFVGVALGLQVGVDVFAGRPR